MTTRQKGNRNAELSTSSTSIVRRVTIQYMRRTLISNWDFLYREVSLALVHETLTLTLLVTQGGRGVSKVKCRLHAYLQDIVASRNLSSELEVG